MPQSLTGSPEQLPATRLVAGDPEGIGETRQWFATDCDTSGCLTASYASSWHRQPPG